MWVIETDSKYCRDCYKCLKYCPVKAIRFETSASRIVEERCILCGNCIRVCPQKAKKDISYLPEVQNLIASGSEVVASLAPSFVAFFHEFEAGRTISLLRRLGFAHVEETAMGAYQVAQATREEVGRSQSFVIGSACPAAVYLIERYFPQYLPNLSRVVSPAVAHARMIKRHYGEDVKVVFISPCTAKKREVFENQFRGLIDYPISFHELEHWAGEKALTPEAIGAPTAPDRQVPGFARLFPLRGGILKTAGLDDGYTATSHLSISGANNIINFLKYLSVEKYPSLRFVDFLMCEGGCINGPLGWHDLNPINRLKVAEYQTESGDTPPVEVLPTALFVDRTYENQEVRRPEPDEEKIREILAHIGKPNKESELDCGACGYSTCREKAVAVFQGMAEAEMCVPYMRQKAESLANLIVENTPNGMVTVDKNLRILSTNPAFLRHFGLDETQPLIGQPLENVIGDTGQFTRTFATRQIDYQKVYFEQSKKWFSQITFPMGEEEAIVGLFVDQTSEESQRQEIEKVRGEIAGRTQEVILKQMRVAQEIASLLGETTAETKALLSKLAKILASEDQHAHP